jgi:hypothetical protein
MEEQKSDPPLDRDRGISFPSCWSSCAPATATRTCSTLAARLDRMDRQLTPDQREDRSRQRRRVPARPRGPDPRPPSTPTPRRARPARSSACPRAEPATSSARRPGGAARGGRRAHRLRPEAVRGPAGGAQGAGRHWWTRVTSTRSPSARARTWRWTTTPTRRWSASSRPSAGAARQLDALMVLYSRPYAQRLTRKQLMELVAAIQRPPRQWTSEALWAGLRARGKGRVRGAAGAA